MKKALKKLDDVYTELLPFETQMENLNVKLSNDIVKIKGDVENLKEMWNHIDHCEIKLNQFKNEKM